MSRRLWNATKMKDNQNLDINANNDMETSSRPRRKRELFVTHLKYLRKSAGLTLESLSDITGISISYLSRLESGSRRLNTDLISRLSKAFCCDPAELLQDFSDHDMILNNKSARPIMRTSYMPGSSGYMSRRSVGINASSVLDIRSDLPVYELCQSEFDALIMRRSENENRARPPELSNHRDAIAIRTNGHLALYFSKTSVLYAIPDRSIIPEATVITILNDNTALVKKIWSVAPNNIQFCEVDQIERLKSAGTDKISIERYTQGPFSAQNSNTLSLIEISRDLIKDVYVLVGYIDLALV